MLVQYSELTARPGRNGALGPLVTKMRDVLSEASGTPFNAWVAFGGRPYGTYVLTARHADHASMIGGMMQMAASAAWAEVSAAADGVLAQPATSRLVEVVGVAGGATEPKPFTVLTTSMMSGTDLARTVAWSLEMAEHVSTLTGQSVLVANAAAGSMFEIGWAAGADTPAALDASNAAISGDARYLEMLGEAGSAGLFVPGSTDRVLLARMP